MIESFLIAKYLTKGLGGGVKLRHKTKRKDFMTEKPVGRPIRLKKESKGIENLEKLKAWIKNNPKKFYGIIAVALVLVLSLSVWSVIQNNIKKAEMQAKIEQEKAKIKKEESRDYFIKVEDVNADCVATFNSSTDSLGCNKIKISGEFSKYETVELRESFSSDDSLDVNGGKFEKNKESSFGLYQFYSRDNYNPQDTNFFEEKVTFEIFNKVLNKVVKSKTITIRYNLTDEDKNLFVNKFNEYKNKKQAEAEEQQRKQAEEKAAQEKKEAERKAAEERAKREASRYKVSQSAAKQFCKDQVISRHPQIGSVKVSDYFGDYKEFYNDDNTFDKNGDYIIRYQWNGKNKQTGQNIGFNCYISGKSDNEIILHYLSAGSLDLYGSLNFEEYNKDGQIVQ